MCTIDSLCCDLTWLKNESALPCRSPEGSQLIVSFVDQDALAEDSDVQDATVFRVAIIRFVALQSPPRPDAFRYSVCALESELCSDLEGSVARPEWEAQASVSDSDASVSESASCSRPPGATCWVSGSAGDLQCYSSSLGEVSSRPALSE